MTSLFVGKLGQTKHGCNGVIETVQLEIVQKTNALRHEDAVRDYQDS